MARRLVIEWTRATVRLALAEERGRQARLLTLLVEPVGPGGDVAGALRALLKKVKPSWDQVIGIIPREQVITRTVKFPTTQPAELAQMVELYARAQLPYPRAEALVDFHVMRQLEGFSTVAIIACQREVAERYLALLREAGLSIGLVTVSSWGVLGWARRALYQHGTGRALSRAGPRTAPEPSLVVNVDDTRTDLALIAEGRLLSSRSVGQGSQDWEVSGEAVELLALEVERSRAAVRKELSGTEIRSMVFTGMGPLGQWAEQLGQRLALPASAIEGREPFTEWTSPAAAPISPVVIGGAACSESRDLLNLNPPELRVQVRHRQQVRDLVTMSVLFMAVLALGAGVLALQISRQQRMAKQVDRVLEDIEPTAQHLQETARTTRLVTTLMERRRRLAATLAGVFRTTPPAVALEAVTHEGARGELVLRGSAASTQEVLGYIASLESLEGIRGVHLKYSTRRTTPTGERTDFELVLSAGPAG